ncbi:hypothetical protein [Bosea sp. (in: a-proteobacteria)]|uniref:hypothetical protein n=1 Tax=Bosea sp. (in: a-proteobacteria) TaxID=1871050 RepID=UPI0026290121|nr:hypothetical protein [Bosea sp. (in: a-proteobacteria)]MCO5089502.1 hypothetical protein [Bosea sp. (in: a-proteobacteria)]
MFASRADALSVDQLKAIIGGVRAGEKRELDGDDAAALTAGSDAAEPAALKSSHGGLADDRSGGNADKDAAKHIKELEKELRGGQNTETGAPGGKVLGKSFTKAEYERTSQGWTKEVSTDATAAAKAEETANKARQDKADKAEIQKDRAETKAKLLDGLPALGEKIDKALEKGTASRLAGSKPLDDKPTPDKPIPAGFKELHDTISKQKAQAPADRETLKAAEHVKELATIKHDGANQIVKHAEKSLDAVAKSNAHSKNPEAVKAATQKLADAYAEQSKTAKELKSATSAHDAAKQKIADSKQAVEDAKQKLGKDPADKKASEDGARQRSQSVADKPAQDKASDDDGRGRSKTVSEPRSKEIETKPGALDKVQKMAASSWKGGNKQVSKLLEAHDKSQAKKNGTYQEDVIDEVLAGGVTDTVMVDGNTKHQIVDMAQVKVEGGTVSYTNGSSKGASAAWTIRAEVGKEHVATEDLGDGATRTTTDKAYAGASFENKAKYAVTKNSVAAEASTKVAVHAEVSHSTTTKIGDTEQTQTVAAMAHAEAGAKAGFRLGFDGLSAEAKAAVEAVAKVDFVNETKVGDLTSTEKLELYAQAKAEAKIGAEVTFNPFEKDGKIKIKGGYSAEASAGVGAYGEKGLHGKNGGGADVGGGVYIGKIGGHLDTDFDFKDGKLNAEIDFGGGLGIGFNGKIKITGDVNEATKSVQEGAKALDELGIVGQVVKYASPVVHITNFFRGFFS